MILKLHERDGTVLVIDPYEGPELAVRDIIKVDFGEERRVTYQVVHRSVWFELQGDGMTYAQGVDLAVRAMYSTDEKQEA